MKQIGKFLRNIIFIFVGVGRTDVKRVETRAMIGEAVRLQNQPESAKHEATTS